LASYNSNHRVDWRNNLLRRKSGNLLPFREGYGTFVVYQHSLERHFNFGYSKEKIPLTNNGVRWLYLFVYQATLLELNTAGCLFRCGLRPLGLGCSEDVHCNFMDFSGRQNCLLWFSNAQGLQGVEAEYFVVSVFWW